MRILSELSDPVVWVPTAICVVSLLAYKYYVNVYTYWDRRNIKSVKRIVPILPELFSILFGNRHKLVMERRAKLGKIYGSFFLGIPQMIICDPEIIRQITTKDFDFFQDHQLNYWHNKYQGKFLIWLQGQHWRRVRALMTPSFTSTKIRRMFRLLEGCAKDLVENFSEQLERSVVQGDKKAIVDLHELFGMYTMDGITTCCYGIKLQREQSLREASSRNAFVRDANRLFEFNFLGIFLTAVLPEFLFKKLGISMTPESALQPMAKRVEQLIERRRKGVENTKFDDLLQSLLDANLDDKMELNEMDQKENHHASLTHETLIKDQERLVKKSLREVEHDNGTTKPAVKLDNFEVLAESMFLLAAGLDTTRSSLSTITYFLAHNPHVQQRLYDELASIATSDPDQPKYFKFDYDTLTSCNYLDAVISESLRMFGPVSMIDRSVLSDYHIEKYDIPLKKGDRILLGFHSVQNDPEYWDEPERFNPDRFMPGEREKIIPGTYVPFSLGPRHCIGMRFSLTETKLGLAMLVMRFKFEPAPNTKYPPVPKAGAGLINIKDCRVCLLSR